MRSHAMGVIAVKQCTVHPVYNGWRGARRLPIAFGALRCVGGITHMLVPL